MSIALGWWCRKLARVIDVTREEKPAPPSVLGLVLGARSGALVHFFVSAAPPRRCPSLDGVLRHRRAVDRRRRLSALENFL